MRNQDRKTTGSEPQGERGRAGNARLPRRAVPARLARSATALFVATLVALARLGSAQAAPPNNDLFGGATASTSGFTEVLATTEATTDANDAQLNAFCGAPATDASVWYAFTAAADGVIVVDVSQSKYSAGVLIGVGMENNLQLVTCGPQTVSFFATAGTTYYALAIDDQFDGGGNGGTLSISFTAVQSPTVDVTVDPSGLVDAHTGIATISGTYTCEHGSFIDMSVNAQQKVGRVATIQGFGFFSDFGTCDGQSHPWSATLFSSNGGRFAGGKALSVVVGFSCGSRECASSYMEQTVQLHGGK